MRRVIAIGQQYLDTMESWNSIENIYAYDLLDSQMKIIMMVKIDLGVKSAQSNGVGRKVRCVRVLIKECKRNVKLRV